MHAIIWRISGALGQREMATVDDGIGPISVYATFIKVRDSHRVAWGNRNADI